jgi:WD40 repeat protein
LEAERLAKEAEKTARGDEARQRGIAEAALAEAERANYFRNITWAERDWQANNVARVEQLLDECKTELRGWEWRYLKRLCHADLLTVKHDSGVKSIAFSQDGRYLSSGSANGTVRVFSPVTGEEFFNLKLTSDGIHSLAFEPASNRLVAAGGSDVFVLDPITGESVRKIAGHSATVNAVAWSSDGKRLASGSGDKTARIWNADSGQLLHTLTGHTESVRSVAFSPDGRRLATGSGELARPDGGRSGGLIPEVPGEVRVWDANEGKPVFTLSRRESVVSSVGFSPSGDFIAAGHGNGTLKLWDASTGQPAAPFPRGHTDGVRGMAFDSQSNRLVSASADTTVRVWAIQNGAELANYRGHTKEVTCVAMSGDGKLIASGSEDKTLKLWNAASGAEPKILRGHAVAVEFSPEGRLLAFVGRTGVEVWDFLNGEKTFSFKKSDAIWGWGAAFSPDGAYFTASEGGTVGVWNTKTWEKVHTLKGQTRSGSGSVYGLAYSPDGKQLASGSGPFRGEVKIWNASTGTEIQTLQGSTNAVWNVAFSPDGKRLAAAVGNYMKGPRWPPGEVKIWDLTTGNVVHTLRGHQYCVWDLAFSADGRHLASCAAHYGGSSEGAEIKIWDSHTSKEITSLPVDESCITSISLSPDSTRLVSGAGAYKSQKPARVSFWDLRTGKEVFSLHGHNGAVYSVTFSRNGKYLATGSEDGTVRIWNADEVTPESKTARRLALLGKETVERAARDRTNRWEEAYRILSQRIEQSTNSLARNNAIRNRAAVLRQLNRASKIEASLLPEPRFRVIDLSTHHNAGLNETWHTEGSPLSSLGTGIQKLAGVDFDVWGLIQVGANASNGMAYPKQISGITVARQSDQLHFLHAAIHAGSATNGAQIGSYVIHYADGQLREIPIRAGIELADWWTHSRETNTQFTVAWTGTNEKSAQYQKSIRLFKTTWKNPRPDVEIASIDFLSRRNASPGRAAAAPFLVAITAEP